MVKKSNINSKKGFTIIEVVLVLAIAGLIFLMVFIALPALQRSQRNTQRRDDYSMLVTAVNSYMASNNGKLGNLIKSNQPTRLKNSRWVNSTGEDPNGNPYEVTATTFQLWDSAGSKAPSDSIAEDSSNSTRSDGTTSSTGSQVFVVIKANCSGVDANGDPQPASDTAARAFAVYGYLEGGSVFCQDSGSNGS
ncbi:type II secretion system protein [Candidatus Saccharibacteria bacterium]|nr:type II secretion system protein [Candidatus Saccharibacteria bacterium]